MPSSLPIYRDILNQANALEQVSIYQIGPAWNTLKKAAKTIQNATEVVIVSIGASYAASIPFIYRFAGKGRRVILEDAAEFLHYTNSSYQNNATVFMLISRSGETIEISRTLQLLKRRGQFVIGITNEADSILAKQSDLPLLIGGPSDHLVAVQTYLTTLLTLHLLAEVTINDSPPDHLVNQLRDLVELERTQISFYKDRSLHWKQEMRSYQAIYMLARGVSMASAHQGALMLHEMSRFPGIVFSAGHFRHGPWEVVDGRIRCFVFAPQDATYELNLSLAKDLEQMGGDVTVVTGNLPGGSLKGIQIWETPQIDPILAPFFEIIPLQFYCYEFADWQGITPGQFRASTPITLAEAGSLLST